METDETSELGESRDTKQYSEMLISNFNLIKS